jgi:DNA helicase HerA-like ATPase
MTSYTEFKKIIYEKIEISSLRKIESTPKNFKILGMNIIFNKNIFNISNRYISEIRIKSINENLNSENMLNGLFLNGFEGMFTLSYEPFNYEIRFSIVSNSLEKNKLDFSKLKSSILSSYPNAEIEKLEISPNVIIFPIGGIPISKYKNSLIVLRKSKFSAISFLSFKIDDSTIIEDGLENSLRSSIESNCSLRFCIPIKSYNGILSSLYLWIKKKKILSEYSKIYKELQDNKLFNNRGEIIGYNLDKSNKINFLYSKYEKLNKIGYWKCSPIIVVIGPPSINIKEAYIKQRKYVEAIKASFSSSFGINIKEIGSFNLNEIARNLLSRKILNNKIDLTNEELSLFINIPNVNIPSISYLKKKNIEFEFNLNELKRNGILLGYYEYSKNKLKIKIGIEDLPLHLAIFGVPGSGKTTLVKKLIKRYIDIGGNVMIFDRHGEYNEFNDFIILDSNNLRINLFENNLNHESNAKILSEIFSMAWPNEFGPLVSSIFRRMYLKYIFKFDNRNLISFIYFIEKNLNDDIIFKSQKAKDKAFSLLSRLSELAEGEIGKIFNCCENETRIEELLNNNVIFDLSKLDIDRDSNILTWIILKKIYDYRKRNKNIGLPHVIVCEEAHNIVPSIYEGQETIIEKMLKEMRKFNESIWIIDQSPLSLSRDILRMCGTIICLRLQYSSDVDKISDTFHLNEEQSIKIQELNKGEAIVLLPRINNAIPIRVSY